MKTCALSVFVDFLRKVNIFHSNRRFIQKDQSFTKGDRLSLVKNFPTSYEFFQREILKPIVHEKSNKTQGIFLYSHTRKRLTKSFLVLWRFRLPPVCLFGQISMHLTIPTFLPRGDLSSDKPKIYSVERA